jgi:hypothetical protein
MPFSHYLGQCIGEIDEDVPICSFLDTPRNKSGHGRYNGTIFGDATIPAPSNAT